MSTDEITAGEADRLARLARYVYWSELGDRDRAVRTPSDESLDAWLAVILVVRSPSTPPCSSVYWCSLDQTPSQLVRCDRPRTHLEPHDGPMTRNSGQRGRVSWSDDEGIPL